MKNKNCKVSIIMGVYNCEATLSRAIESILNQTYENWELVMCNDCSTDNTYKVAKQYADRYKNIFVIQNSENRGLAYSLNRCLEVSTGKYIARMDGDDICLPARLKVQVDFLNNNQQYDVVGSSVILFDENGDKGIRRMIQNPSKYDIIKSVPHVHPTIMMKKEVYEQLNGYTVSTRTRRGQDLDLWFRFHEKGFKGYNIEQPLLKYHESINDYKKRSLKAAFTSMQTIYMGYRMLNFPIRKYIYILKPLIAVLIPNKLMYLYHKNRG